MSSGAELRSWNPPKARRASSTASCCWRNFSSAQMAKNLAKLLCVLAWLPCFVSMLINTTLLAL